MRRTGRPEDWTRTSWPPCHRPAALKSTGSSHTTVALSAAEQSTRTRTRFLFISIAITLTWPWRHTTGRVADTIRFWSPFLIQLSFWYFVCRMRSKNIPSIQVRVHTLFFFYADNSGNETRASHLLVINHKSTVTRYFVFSRYFSWNFIVALTEIVWLYRTRWPFPLQTCTRPLRRWRRASTTWVCCWYIVFCFLRWS